MRREKTPDPFDFFHREEGFGKRWVEEDGGQSSVTGTAWKDWSDGGIQQISSKYRLRKTPGTFVILKTST